MPTILVVEDEDRMAQSLKRGLERKGYGVQIISNGIDARIFDISTVDLVILDWGLPVFDGIAVLEYWRNTQNYTTPVLMFTARNEVLDTVTGLDHGADDYMSKFFEWHELYARIRALLRRSGYTEKSLLVAGDISWDKEKIQFFEQNHPIPYTATEYKLMAFLFEHSHQIVSQSQLITHLYDIDHEPDSNVVSRHIKSIRKKTNYDPIETIRGMGYRLRSSS